MHQLPELMSFIKSPVKVLILFSIGTAKKKIAIGTSKKKIRWVEPPKPWKGLKEENV